MQRNNFVTFSLTISKRPCYNGAQEGDKGDETFPQRLCRWVFFSLCRPLGGIMTLTCTIFDPIIFLRNSVSTFFHISLTRLKKIIMGNYPTSLVKSHTGATQALTRARESCFVCLKIRFVQYYSFFSVFALWHKADGDTTVAKLLSEIGDIRRFSNADKLANFAGTAPVNFSSAGKGDDTKVYMFRRISIKSGK